MATEERTVIIYQYNGYHGTYARSRELLWRCTIIGANGAQKFGGGWASEGVGYRYKAPAVRDANQWSEFLGWPVVDLGRAEEFDDTPKG